MFDVRRYYAGWPDKMNGKVLPLGGDFFSYTRREPVGIVGQIIPVNIFLVNELSFHSLIDLIVVEFSIDPIDMENWSIGRFWLHDST